MIRHVFASHSPRFARELGIPLTLQQARLGGFGERGGQTGPSAVAVTFDDGPHPEGTPAVLDVLAAHDAVATFFLVGEQVRLRPQLARRILESGHAVALHGFRHRAQVLRGGSEVEQDIVRGIAAIEDATGMSPRVHRPPFGIYSAAGLAAVRERGLQPLLWSLWGKDWRRFTTPERIANRAVTGRRAGDVLLLHDADYYSSKRSHERTVAALPQILTTLRAAELATVRAA